jgi:hypothetical protein
MTWALFRRRETTGWSQSMKTKGWPFAGTTPWVSRFAEVELLVPLKHGVAEPLGLAAGHRVGAAGLGQDGACVLLAELSDFARGDAVDFDAQRDREVGLVSQDGDLVDDGAVELVGGDVGVHCLRAEVGEELELQAVDRLPDAAAGVGEGQIAQAVGDAHVEV